jgi:hypothetical protein
VKIDPVLHALVQDPPGFFEKAVAELHFGFPAVVARVVVAGPLGEPLAVDLYFSALDVVDQKIEDGDEVVL